MASGNTVEKNIRDWLHKQGYPLEMQVAQQLRQSGMWVQQSSLYLDTSASVVREIDVLARSSHLYRQEIDQLSTDIYSTLTLCVECKLSKDKPWIIFKAPTKRPSFRLIPDIAPLCAGDAYEYFSWLYRNGCLNECSLFQPTNRMGYSIAQAFSEGVDIPYKAINGALSAAKSEALEHPKSLEDKPDEVYFSGNFILPVVVFDNQLFECYLDASGGLRVNEVDHAVLRMDELQISEKTVQPTLAPIVPSVIVSIYTAKALVALIRHASELDKVLSKHMIEYMKHKIEYK